MNRLALVNRVRKLTRDLSSSIFQEPDVVDYLNEGIQRMRQVIPELKGLTELGSNESSPSLLPESYHHLLALYSASRCFDQDERHYQATTRMNEFEQKLEELRGKIEIGLITIVDANGNEVTNDYVNDYVTDNYFSKRYDRRDLDKGVEGV